MTDFSRAQLMGIDYYICPDMTNYTLKFWGDEDWGSNSSWGEIYFYK